MRAGSHSHLLCTLGVLLLKLLALAGAEGFEPSLAVLETVVLTVGRHPYVEEETRFELAEVLPSPPFQDGALNHSATLP